MKDYLGHLAARTLAAEPLIRPRPRSLFERPPERAVFEPSPQPRREASPSSKAGAPAPSATDLAAITAEPPALAQTDASQSEMRGVNSPVAAQESAVLFATISAKTARDPAARRVEKPALSLAPSSPPTARNDATPTTPAQNKTETTPPLFRSPGTPKPESLPVAGKKRGTPADDSKTPSAPVPQTRPSAADPTDREHLPKPAHPAAPVLAPAIRLPDLRASTPPIAETPPPAIHVTIGRLEIRAVTPPSEPRPRAKPADASTLEAYLRKRAGGAAR